MVSLVAINSVWTFWGIWIIIRAKRRRSGKVRFSGGTRLVA